MFRFAVLLLAAYSALAGTALGASSVACVQEEVTQLGYDPGPIDGQFGRKTAAAFAEMQAKWPEQVNAVAAGDLSVDTAPVWCAGLAQSFPELAPVYEKYRPALPDEEAGFKFDIAADVPAERVAEIKEGLAIARAYIAKTFGAEIPADVRRRMTVKIVATGKGNQERGGGGGVATAFAEGESAPRPFFDVAHVQWSQTTGGRGWTTRTDNLKAVTHEYTHGWQMVLGAIDIHEQPLGNWMNEGLAEYVAYSAMADAGLLDWSDAQRFMLRGARGAETDHPLGDYGTTNSPAWAGHVGFVALDWLITDTGVGIQAIKTLADEVAAGRSQRKAFANTFGLELSDFYQQFEAYRALIQADPARAYSARPRLKLAGGEAGAAG